MKNRDDVVARYVPAESATKGSCGESIFRGVGQSLSRSARRGKFAGENPATPTLLHPAWMRTKAVSRTHGCAPGGDNLLASRITVILHPVKMKDVGAIPTLPATYPVRIKVL